MKEFSSVKLPGIQSYMRSLKSNHRLPPDFHNQLLPIPIILNIASGIRIKITDWAGYGV